MKQSVLVNNTLRVKQSNTNLIRNVLKNMDKATRAEISKETELSIATCGNILSGLIEAGEVFEDELEAPRGGRPARKYLYNKNYSLSLCMCIQSDATLKTIRYVITNLYGEIQEDIIKIYDLINIDTIDNLIEKLIKDKPSIKALGIGIPGIAGMDGSVWVNDIEELNGAQLTKFFEEKHGLKVSVASSSNLTAYGYYKAHSNLKGKTLVAFVAPKGYYFGAGIVIDGKMYRGDANLAGEISYMDYGIKREKLLDIKGEKEFSAIVTKAVVAAISFLSPSAIILTGSMFTEDILKQVQEQCKEQIPEAFMPKFDMKIDAADEYLNGVVGMALDSLSANVQLIDATKKDL